MKKIICLSIVIVHVACSGSSTNTIVTPPQQKDTTFVNPLLSSGADPWVYQKDGSYYFMSTSGNNITIRKTAAMSELGQSSPVVVWMPPAAGPNARNIWAPELHYLQGKWYLYYTAGSSSDLATQRCFVLENTNQDPLQGQWIDKGKIGDPAAGFFSIDGTVMEYKGKNYFIWSGQISGTDITQRIYIAEMENPWTLRTARIQISMPQYEWEKHGSPVNEGPEILQNASGQFFLIYSASSCGTDDYALGMLQLKKDGDPLDPANWTKAKEPVFTKSIDHHVYGPGHNGFFISKDGKENWIIYHANPQSGQGCGGARCPCMQRFTWNADGTPQFGVPADPYYKLTKPSGE
ncbi:glycoside hydrolase family 43 protein [Chitinophaga sp. 212800010-3]|uniref:glycoside hydrolase family 43 protein n=1 Tax=unclassified Chitinophaga TaxID=2619133 RepID=UPI002DED4E3D|nr:Glycosyl hydrolase family 43 [Chitinophaga sp. 212800010-3]